MFAEFLYGETHKWFFRTAAAVLVASYAAFVQATFDNSRWWLLYLAAFSATALFYWLIYTPAKWAELDSLFDLEKHGEPLPLVKLHTPLLEYRHSQILRSLANGAHGHQQDIEDDAIEIEPYSIQMYTEETQKILHENLPPILPEIPGEVIVLCEYVRLEGRYKRTGKYTRTRQWRPPGYWAGHTEYRAMLEKGGDEYGPLGHFARSGCPEDEAVYLLIMVLQFLDGSVPKWRSKARKWAARGGLVGYPAPEPY